LRLTCRPQCEHCACIAHPLLPHLFVVVATVLQHVLLLLLLLMSLLMMLVWRVGSTFVARWETSCPSLLTGEWVEELKALPRGPSALAAVKVCVCACCSMCWCWCLRGCMCKHTWSVHPLCARSRHPPLSSGAREWHHCNSSAAATAVDISRGPGGALQAGPHPSPQPPLLMTTSRECRAASVGNTPFPFPQWHQECATYLQAHPAREGQILLPKSNAKSNPSHFDLLPSFGHLLPW
jgi:hypothetical protein